jgi:hypothetical protein
LKRGTIRRARHYQERVVTISAKTDWLCPLGAKEVFPQAHNYIIDKDISDGGMMAHAAFSECPKVFEIIKQELKI